MGGGLSYGVSACNIYALPVASHVSQVWGRPKFVRLAEKNLLQRLTCSPRFALPPETLHRLKDLGHLVEARRLVIYDRACMLRSAINSD
eukprot:4217930-Pyramimonas_sp.AAC.1